MSIRHIILAALFSLTMSEFGIAKSWRGIVPLKSTRADVERLLGPSTGDPPRYYLAENTVYFNYASCRCGEKCKTDNWNVPPDTVIGIRVGMKGVVKLSDLKIDLTNFEKWPGDEDVPGSFFYKNHEEGLAIEGGGLFVSALIYGPRVKDDHLRCPPSSSPPPKNGKAWRGIVPLKSTRADVERLLGPPSGALPTYYLPENTVDILYAKCRCGEKCKNDDWNVRPDTVILIRVGMKGVVKLADLNIDLTTFKKWPGDEDVPGAFSYKNDEEGFAIETGVSGQVSALSYFPPASDDHLRCPPKSPPTRTSAKAWRGIVPLRSTRADVERILGPAKEPAENHSTVHKTEREVVLMQYSTGEPCSGGVNRWRVPRGTVLSIDVAPRTQLRFADLQLDVSKYKVTDGGHVPGYSYYTDESEGIQYEVTQGLVMSITYFPAAKDQNLRCSASRNKSNSACPKRLSLFFFGQK